MQYLKFCISTYSNCTDRAPQNLIQAVLKMHGFLFRWMIQRDSWRPPRYTWFCPDLTCDDLPGCPCRRQYAHTHTHTHTPQHSCGYVDIAALRRRLNRIRSDMNVSNARHSLTALARAATPSNRNYLHHEVTQARADNWLYSLREKNANKSTYFNFEIIL